MKLKFMTVKGVNLYKEFSLYTDRKLDEGFDIWAEILGSIYNKTECPYSLIFYAKRDDKVLDEMMSNMSINHQMAKAA